MKGFNKRFGSKTILNRSKVALGQECTKWGVRCTSDSNVIFKVRKDQGRLPAATIMHLHMGIIKDRYP